MLGIGAVTTSSPTSSSTSRPFSSYAATAQANARVCNSPAYTGDSGMALAKAVHTSVPPLIEASSRSSETAR
jgi:hypothetical protein